MTKEELAELNEPLSITAAEMNLVLLGIEHGFREGEQGKNLQQALASITKIVRTQRAADDFA